MHGCSNDESGGLSALEHREAGGTEAAFFFFRWTSFKVFIEFVTILLLFYILVFWPPSPGIEPTPPAQEGEVLTPGWPGKSGSCVF